MFINFSAVFDVALEKILSLDSGIYSLYFFLPRWLDPSIIHAGFFFFLISISWRTLDLLALEKAMAPHSSILPEKSHGWRSLVTCSLWGPKSRTQLSDFTFTFSLSCIGGGNGNPLQCSCLENPRDWGAWWAAVYGVAHSRTWLKWLSSSSSGSACLVLTFFAACCCSARLPRWSW